MARPAATFWVDNASPDITASNMNTREGAMMDYSEELAKVVLGVNTQTGTTYTLVLADAGKVVEMNNAASNTLTVPPNSSVAFAVNTVIEVFQLGAGGTAVAAGAGVTFQPAGTTAVSAQYKSLRLRKRATDTWAVE